MKFLLTFCFLLIFHSYKAHASQEGKEKGNDSIVNLLLALKMDTLTPVTREELKSSMERIYLSQGPERLSNAKAPVMEIIAKVKLSDHERWHIRYLVDADEYAYAYLLFPLNIKNGKKLPLVICPHPTADNGKDRVVGIYDEPAKDEKEQIKRDNRQYALDLVRRGYITFAPDRAAFGERRSHNGRYKTEMPAFLKNLSKKYPGWGLYGKSVYDLRKAMDFLSELDIVDTSNIAVIGHSLGAWDSILLTAFDERIKAAVVNSGGMMNYKPDLWKDQKALRAYMSDTTRQNKIKTNTNIFVMLAAPRSLLYQYSLSDYLNNGNEQLLEGFRDATEYYKKVNKSKKADLNYYLHGDGHDFTKESRELTYSWLDRRLKAE